MTNSTDSVKHTAGRSIYADPKAPHQELTAEQRTILAALNKLPLNTGVVRRYVATAVPVEEPNPIVLRLQGRIAQLLRHGRVKDPELMQSAVESLTELIDAAQCLLNDMGKPDDGAEDYLMGRLRAAIAKATGSTA